MIEKYGADAVRWFILSDSPPEKDIQWSDSGVVSSNKFLQKLWNISLLIIKRKESLSDKNIVIKLENEIENLASKIDNSISTFKFNVSIALFYEAYSTLNNYLDKKVDNKVLKKSITKIMKLLLPLTPHLANEILDLLECENKDVWPKILKNVNEEIQLAVQINGKTRDVVNLKKDLEQKLVEKFVKEKSKISSAITNKKIVKTIFVKNKVINFVVK